MPSSPTAGISSGFDNSYYNSSSRRVESEDFENPFASAEATYTRFQAQPSTANLVAHDPDDDFDHHATHGTGDEETEDEDEQRLTTAAHPPWRGDDEEDDGYDAERNAGIPVHHAINNHRRERRYVGSSPLRSASIGGSALRAMSRNLRRVSVRVVDLASSGTKDQQSSQSKSHAVRLENEEDDEDNAVPSHHHQAPIEASRPLTDTPLRGNTLGYFGPYSRVRRWLYDALLWP